MIIEPVDDPPPPTPGLILHEHREEVILERVVTERVRVERVIVTEQRTITVDVRHEEIRVTRESVDDSVPRLPPGHRPPDPIVILLREEQIDIRKVVVPVERVTVSVETLRSEDTATQTLAREHVDLVRTRLAPH